MGWFKKKPVAEPLESKETVHILERLEAVVDRLEVLSSRLEDKDERENDEQAQH